ncbi:MAG: amino acid adenylation domain-containing protein [Oscillospiraceae bacterium]|jgi:amino acid adenylation domain-containing protein|nr:amino acid adenylation domain-containing protein [Oscillospiraceae bacterium]
MSKGNNVIIEKIENKLDKYLDGYFELYKSTSPKVINNKNYAIYQYSLNPQVKNKIEKYPSPQDYFFGVFLSLMMRYTQNEMLTGICLQNFNKDSSVFIASTLCDNELTFNDLIKLIVKEKMVFTFEQELLNSVLEKTSDYTNCLFEYTNSLDFQINIDQNNIKTDICFQIVNINEKIVLNIIYNKNAYSEEHIRRMALHYDQLSSCVMEDSDILICKAHYISKDEKETLVDIWNQTDFKFPKERCIHQLFEQRVLEDSNAIAVYYENKTMTREMLNKRANQLAHQLVQSGVKTGDIVALYSNKSINFVIGIMGILKAGCAYLPIDASYPQSRIEYILANSKVSVVVTAVDPGDNYTMMTNIKIVKINSEDEELLDYPVDSPNINVSPRDPCYLIYTSGSTGQPKGVLLNHEGRVSNFHDFNSRFSITNKDKVLAISSVSFDMSAYDVLGSMMAGSSIVLPDPLLEKQPFHWLDLIQKYNVTIWHSVPVLLDLFCKCAQHRKLMRADSIRVVLLGGDWIPLSLPDNFRLINNQSTMISLGGATEVSMDSIIYQIEQVNPDWKRIPYGKPMYNQKAYVLDRNRQLMPIGFPGELYLGGVGVGDGYYLNPEATMERFFDNPWADDPKQRIYKTGDLAYFKPDGNLILLGRMDFQVKINGARIELGEIEHCLSNCEGINRVVATAPKVGTSRKIVVHAEYKSKRSIPKETELIDHLIKWLPKSHVPAHIILTSAIPITPNGKIDRKAIEKLTDDYINNSKKTIKMR